MTPVQLYIAKSGARNAPALPLDAVTRTFGVFGQRGTGKTNAAVVMVEEMVRKGAHVVVLDPVGAWWGITHEGEEGKGLPGVVIGGEHADVPLEESAGHLLADIVIGRHWPLVVIDQKLLRKGAQMRFLADFLEDLYHGNREALHVVFEEADRPLPQSPRGMDPVIGRVLGAAEDIVKYGRGRGLGATLVSQRFATVNKNVTEQIETLLLLRMIGPNDRKAAKLWIESNGDPDLTAKVLATLAQLEPGEAQLYSPGWLHLLERVKLRRRKTFDSSATPEVGAAPVEPTQRAAVNLDELRGLMAETVQRAQENDPKLLHARIAELEAEVEAARSQAPEPERILVPDREAVAELLMAITNLDGAADETHEMLQTALAAFRDAGETVVAALAPVAEKVAVMREVVELASALPANGRAAGYERKHVPAAEMAPVAAGEEYGAEAERERVRKALPHAEQTAGGMSAGAGQLVDALSRFYPLWLDRGQLALLLGRGKRSSTLTQQLAEAVGAGALEQDRGRYRVNPPMTGAERVVGPTRAELRERFLAALPDGPRALLEALLRAEPKAVNRVWLFEQAGFSPTSSTPVTHLKLLVDNGLAAKDGPGLIAVGPAIL